MNIRKFGSSYLLYRETVRDLVCEAGAYVSPEWFETQHDRIGAAYNLGEPVEMIADTIAAFGKGAMVRRSKTPRQLAVRTVKVVTNV